MTRNLQILTTFIWGVFTSLSGQPDFTPEGSVNGSNQLVLDGGQTLISPPISEAPSSIPDVTVNLDGSLDLNDGLEPIEKPTIPIPVFFSDDLFRYTGDLVGWMYHPVLNHIFDSQNGWIYWEDWKFQGESDAFFFIDTDAGSSDGFFTYSSHFSSWCFFYTGDDGFKRLSSATDTQKGLFYVFNPPVGKSNWYYMDQYYAEWAGGAKVGFYINLNDDANNPSSWVRIK